MNPHIATVACALAVSALFLLNRDRTVRTSMALWIPVVWLFIAESRNVSDWLQMNSTADAVDRYFEGNPIDRAALSALMACGVIALFGRGTRLKGILAANTAIVVYFLYCGISMFWSDYPLVTGKRWFRSLGDVIMVLVILTDPNWRAAVKRTLTRVGFLLLPISILFIKYYPNLGRAYDQAGSPSWTGAATGKNSLGMLCLICGLASLWCFIGTYRARAERDRRRRLVAQGAVVTIAMWLLWLADSKTSLICFLLAGSLMILTSFSSFTRKPAVLFLMVISMVSASFAVLFLGVGGGALEAMGRNSSLTGRTDIWKVVLSFVENPWFGAGYDSFWLGDRMEAIARALKVSTLNQSHNGYLEVYLSLGWIGVALLIVLIVAGYRKIVAGFRSDPEVSTIRIAYFVVVVVYNFTEGVFKTMTPIWIVFLLATMAVPQIRRRKARNVAAEVPGDQFGADLQVAVTHSST
jgi:exopolysaccharide production protein ExoQ